jgi:hypothetical protein
MQSLSDHTTEVFASDATEQKPLTLWARLSKDAAKARKDGGKTEVISRQSDDGTFVKKVKGEKRAYRLFVTSNPDDEVIPEDNRGGAGRKANPKAQEESDSILASVS